MKIPVMNNRFRRPIIILVLLFLLGCGVASAQFFRPAGNKRVTTQEETVKTAPTVQVETVEAAPTIEGGVLDVDDVDDMEAERRLHHRINIIAEGIGGLAVMSVLVFATRKFESLRNNRQLLAHLALMAVSCALLLGSSEAHSMNYYTLMRFVVFGTCAYTALLAHSMKLSYIVALMLVAAVLFNPFAPFRFKRERWQQFDYGCVVLVVGSSFIIVRKTRKALP